MSSLIKNVSALLEKSELLIENASTRDEILKADKMLNHYRWKAEKFVPSMQSTSISVVIPVPSSITSRMNCLECAMFKAHVSNALILRVSIIIS